MKRAGYVVLLAAFVALGRTTAVGQAPGLEVLQVRPNFFMIAGAGGNIGVQVGDDGVVIVDAGSADKRTRSWRRSRTSRRAPSAT